MKVFDKAIESRLDRRSTFVALGGGVIGDMCGYAAASFLRGVNFIQIPTTVMAQVCHCSKFLASFYFYIIHLVSFFFSCFCLHFRWILLLGERLG